MQRERHKSSGSTLLAATFTIAIGALLIGAFYQTLMPRFRSVHQSASWHDALQGAEAGANHTVHALNQFALSTANADNYDWAANGWTFTDSNYVANGERTLATASMPALGGNNNVALTRVAVDVYTRATSARNPPWFRIRSTARADLPGRFTSADRRDLPLRRMKLGAKSGGVADPHVTRTVEVIAKPQYRFSNAITTRLDLRLGNSSGWIVDSFDSTDAFKSEVGSSAGGYYPASLAKRQSNGNIGSMMTAPNGTPYTALIHASGATVAGEVWTNGGDNPNTTSHENVSNNTNVDPNRIHDTFYREFQGVTEPVWTSTTAAPSGNTAFTTGTQFSPRRYIVNGPLGGFTVTAPASGTTGFIEIIVKGNLDTNLSSSKDIVIPPNVYATIYVNGNVDFSNGMINASTQSSRVASRLTLYGLSTAANATYVASGNAVQILSFYGPNYGVALNGTVTTVGSVVSKTFTIDGGGNGGFHYDESLGRGGDIESWKTASYFDDSRTDL